MSVGATALLQSATTRENCCSSPCPARGCCPRLLHGVRATRPFTLAESFCLLSFFSRQLSQTANNLRDNSAKGAGYLNGSLQPASADMRPIEAFGRTDMDLHTIGMATPTIFFHERILGPVVQGHAAADPLNCRQT